MFDTEIAIVVREDPVTWRKLNVTASPTPTGGIVDANEGLLGERYEDATGNTYSPLVVQPMIVPGAALYRPAMERGARLSLYIENVFSTGHDAANRAVVKRCAPEAMSAAGPVPREGKKAVEKITEVARMHARAGGGAARARRRGHGIRSLRRGPRCPASVARRSAPCPPTASENLSGGPAQPVHEHVQQAHHVLLPARRVRAVAQ